VKTSLKKTFEDNRMGRLHQLFKHSKCNIIGMLHVPALPGSPTNCLSMSQILQRVETEVELYNKAGVDGFIVENMHDTPYCLSRDLGPHTTAAMAVVASRVREKVDNKLPVGVQVLAGGNKQALAVCAAAGLQFCRVEGFVFGHLGDEGWIEACAGPLMRYRREIGCEEVGVICDIKKKHSAHAVTADVDIAETAKAAQFFRADGVIVTGSGTGDPASPGELEQVLQVVPDIPTFIGSGVTKDNICNFKNAFGLIIGSYFKQGGNWENDLELERIQALIEAADKLR